MIDQIKELLRERNFTNVVIIDDAYDDQPTPEDIQQERWDRFFDDLQDRPEEKLAKEAYGADEYERQDDPIELGRTPKFLATVWRIRTELGALAQDLFREFERARERKRAELAPLERLLQHDLGLLIQMVGRNFSSPNVDKAPIIFLDLFLGSRGDETAMQRALQRIRDIVTKRRSDPPIVVLMSASQRLSALGTTVRDGAELLGCQFRMMRKAELADSETTLERMYELVIAYPDSLHLNGFLQAWDTALEQARLDFLRSIRTLDLADYANMHALILDAEGQAVGDYAIDLYDLYLHKVIEGNTDLVRAAKKLNKIDWSQ